MICGYNALYVLPGQFGVQSLTLVIRLTKGVLVTTPHSTSFHDAVLERLNSTGKGSFAVIKKERKKERKQKKKKKKKDDHTSPRG